MRQVVLDTETTGLEVEQGHRVIEIGCVELVNRRRTQNTWHCYLQPDREIDEAAEQVHGISREMLADRPRFAEIAETFIDYIGDAELIIHNAEFDVGFLNRELELAELQPATLAQRCKITDSLQLARRLHPGQRNSLDALCKRYAIDNSGRDLHGALLDAQLLADVYLAMTGGQGKLVLDSEQQVASASVATAPSLARDGLNLALIAPTDAELKAHERQLDLIDQQASDGSVWRRVN